MTSNSLRYHELEETKRHNRIMEMVQSRDVAEKTRHNLATEVENTRSAQAKEAIDTGSLLEQRKHNRETERQTAIFNNATTAWRRDTLEEDRRRNLVNEDLNRLGLRETNRHNLVTEGISSRSLDVSARSAEASIRSAAAAQTNASANMLNAQTNSRAQDIADDKWGIIKPFAEDTAAAELELKRAQAEKEGTQADYNRSLYDLNQEKIGTERWNQEYTKNKAHTEERQWLWNAWVAQSKVIDSIIPF